MSVSCVAVILVLMLLWTSPAPSFWEILFIIVIIPAAAFVKHFTGNFHLSIHHLIGSVLKSCGQGGEPDSQDLAWLCHFLAV